MDRYATSVLPLRSFCTYDPSSAALHIMSLISSLSRSLFRSCLTLLWILSSSGTPELRLLKLASNLLELLPGSKTSSSCKVRRRQDVCLRWAQSILLAGGYHGRTFGTMALTKSKTVYSQDVFPLMVRRFCALSRTLTPTWCFTAGSVDHPFPLLASVWSSIHNA